MAGPRGELVAWLTLEKRRLRLENEQYERENRVLRAELARLKGVQDGRATVPVGDADTDHRRDG